MKLVTHVHTRYSKDSMLCFWPLYLKCCLLKINAIAITEHDNIAGSIAFKKFCEKRKKHILVIVGEEIFTSEGEIIGLYLKENIPANLSAKETIYRIQRQNGLIYIPHPYDTKRQRTVLKETVISNNKESIDCIEVHNGRNISSEYDKRQSAIAEKYNLNQVIGSDAHTWIEIGRDYMEVNILPDSPEKFRLAIQNAVFHPKKCIRIAHQITRLIKIAKLIKSGKYYELYRAIIGKIKRGQHRGC